MSKIDIFFGQHFHVSTLWQRDILTSPFEEGGSEKAVFHSITVILFEIMKKKRQADNDTMSFDKD